MKVKAGNGKVYEVSGAAPGGAHEVELDGKAIGSFVLEAETTRVTVKSKEATEALLNDIADRFVDLGGAPVGMI